MKIVYVILGFVAMIIGSIGIVLPVLPTTPFLLVAAICFASGCGALAELSSNLIHVGIQNLLLKYRLRQYFNMITKKLSK